MRIGLSTTGLHKFRDPIEAVLQGSCTTLPLPLSRADIVVGWGNKPTSFAAQTFARSRNLPYVAFEDGFLRSVFPGPDELPVALVRDRTGIYYDAGGPCDLEAYVLRREACHETREKAEQVLSFLRAHQLSKYNNYPEAGPEETLALNAFSRDRGDNILVIDQTAADASITGALAKEATFADMLLTAVAENPDHRIFLKVHPETMLGRKSGHFDHALLNALADRSAGFARALESGQVRLMPERINPWKMLAKCSKVYCVSSQLGFEALMAECEVHCFGVPFYAGWGLTRDRQAAPRRRRPASMAALVAATYLDYSFYFDFDSRSIVSFREAAEELLDRRNRFRQSLSDHAVQSGSSAS